MIQHGHANDFSVSTSFRDGILPAMILQKMHESSVCVSSERMRGQCINVGRHGSDLADWVYAASEAERSVRKLSAFRLERCRSAEGRKCVVSEERQRVAPVQSTARELELERPAGASQCASSAQCATGAPPSSGAHASRDLRRCVKHVKSRLSRCNPVLL